MGDQNSEKIELEFFCIWIIGHDTYPVALFRYEEHAELWARDFDRGNWLTKKIKLEVPPFATREQLCEAAEEAGRLIKELRWDESGRDS